MDAIGCKAVPIIIQRLINQSIDWDVSSISIKSSSASKMKAGFLIALSVSFSIIFLPDVTMDGRCYNSNQIDPIVIEVTMAIIILQHDGVYKLIKYVSF